MLLNRVTLALLFANSLVPAFLLQSRDKITMDTSNIVALNNIHHKDLKIITAYSEQHGNNVASVLTFPTEFAQIQREYPILFQKLPQTGEFQSIALLGIKAGENLFIRDNEWHASYIPAIVSSEPFIIGFEDQSNVGGSEHQPIIYVDMNSSRISQKEGEAVFREFGGNTSYLEKITQNLHALYQGFSSSQAMFALFNELALIEPVSLEIKLNNDQMYRLQGNYTINPDKLAALDGHSLAKLHAAGFLECAFFVSASLNNMQKLIDIKNSRI